MLLNEIAKEKKLNFIDFPNSRLIDHFEFGGNDVYTIIT